MVGLRKIKQGFLLIIIIVFISGLKSLADTNDQKNPALLSNRYTQFEDDLSPVTSRLTITPDYKKFAESDKLIVYVNEKDLSLLIKNKLTGYLWSTTVNQENTELNNIWLAYANSAITIYYYQAKRAETTKQESITTSPNSKVTILYINNGFIANIQFGISKITLKFKVTLKDSDNLNLEILNHDITEENNLLANLRIYPFMGAIKGYEIPGYIFIPDGVGALMRINRPNNKSPYHKQIYDNDIAFTNNDNKIINNPNQLEQDYTRSDEKIHLPVFGYSHGINQNAYLASIDKGAGYASIGLLPSGTFTKYHHIYPEFHYRYRFIQPTSRSNTITILQSNRNNFDISLNYFFLEVENANYVGMARRYSEHLVANNILTDFKDTRINVPIRLEFLGSERTKGLFFDHKTVMTTINEMHEIINDLQANNINDLTVVYQGWSKGGLTGSAPNYFPIDKKNGNKNDLSRLINYLEEGHSDFLLAADYLKAYEKAGGYSRINDLAKKANTLLMSGNNYNYRYNLLNSNATTKLFNHDLKEYETLGVNIALQDLGNVLFTDYSNGVQTREDNQLLYSDIVNQEKVKVGLYRANKYLFKGLDYYFDLPIFSSQFFKFDDTVPFLPIVLNGYIEGYSSYNNFFATDELLRLIDYGIYPSFILTKNPAHLLINTPSERIYTSSYDNWKDEINRQYHFINNALKAVYGRKIISRTVITPGVIEVIYDNGIKIIINYTKFDYDYQGITINKSNYQVVGG